MWAIKYWSVKNCRIFVCKNSEFCSMPVDHKAEEHKSQNRMDTQNSNCLSITRILCWWNWAPGDWRDKTEDEEDQTEK